MNIFDSYSQRVRNSIKQDREKKSVREGFSSFTGTDTLANVSGNPVGSIRRTMKPENSLLSLNHVIKQLDISDVQVGKHTDFRYLIGTELTEMHYITSTFIDIKGSTQMNDTYDLDTQYTVTNTILSAAIHVCLLFGGHIQRLQGDGIFVYFGGKNVEKGESVRQALGAASMFTYFVKNDLQKIFEEDGIENISTRTGIDFGDDHEVLWGNFGITGCMELTTQSLHTSLAAKCQQHASRNGIVVGQNVKERLQIDEKYFDLVRNSKGEVTERYIYIGRKKNVYYTQYAFEWFKYLKSLSYIRADNNDNLYIVSPQQQEEERLERLRKTASVILNGNAFTNSAGIISSDTSGVKNQEHRFHYAK